MSHSFYTVFQWCRCTFRSCWRLVHLVVDGSSLRRRFVANATRRWRLHARGKNQPCIVSSTVPRLSPRDAYFLSAVTLCSELMPRLKALTKEERRSQGVALLQRCVRGHIGRRAFWRHRKLWIYGRESRQATTVQKVFRGHMARVMYAPSLLPHFVVVTT